MSYRGILKRFREQLLGTGLSEATVEVCVLRVRHRTWSQGRMGMKLGISQPAVSQHLTLAMAAIPQWAMLLHTRRGRPSLRTMREMAVAA